MSIAKINIVNKSRKDQECEKCKTPIPAGNPYRWFVVGFRSKYKHVRCMKVMCSPRESERESSLLSGVYAAQEWFHDSVPSLNDHGDIEQSVHDVAEAISEVAEQYRDAGTDENGNEWRSDMIERADLLDEGSENLSNWSAEDEVSLPDPVDDHDDILSMREECPVCADLYASWIPNVRAAATEAVDTIELP